MKRLAGMISLILAVSMVLGAFGFAASYPDVSNSANYYSPVSLLSSLGIIKGYEDGTFGPDRNVTRAEFTVMLMRAMANSGVSNDITGVPFTDLETVKEWAGGDIKTAYSLGIINGMDETTFAPDEQVTIEQALKMIVCALGYESVALSYVGNDRSQVWPGGYVSAAYSIKLNSGVTSTGETPAKRWEIAMMVYNALEVKIMESISYGGEMGYRVTEKTLLNDYLRMYKSTGELRADANSSMEEGKRVREGEVLILDDSAAQGEVMNLAKDVSTDKLVGMAVRYYYSEDVSGIKTVVYIEKITRDSSVLELTADMIQSAEKATEGSFTIRYLETEDSRTTKNISIASNASYLVNGGAVNSSSITEQDLMPEMGDITLIDNNSDGVYDKVTINSYVTYVVKSYISTTYKLTDMYRTASDKVIDLDTTKGDLELNIKGTNGGELTASSLNKEYNVLAVQFGKAGTKNLINITVSTESVTGVITGISASEKMLTVDGKTYETSKYFNDYNKDKFENGSDKFNIGDSATFYFDKDGKIAAYKKGTSSTMKYGYVAGVMSDNGNVSMYVISEPGAPKKEFEVASKVLIDNSSYSGDNIVRAMIDISEGNTLGKGGYINVDGKTVNGSQLIRYGTNSSGQISSIDTVEGSGGLQAYNKNTDSTWTFSTTTKMFTNGSETIKINENTIVFLAPEGSRDKIDKYSSVKYTNSSTIFRTGNNYTYQIEAYDVDTGTGKQNLAKVLVVHGSEAAKIEYLTDAVIIKSIKKDVPLADGQLGKEIIGYRMRTPGDDSKPILAESGAIDDCNVGDVIKYETTPEGYIQAGSVQRLLNVASNNIEPFTTDHTNEPLAPTFSYIHGANPNTGGNDYRLVHGLLYEPSDSTPGVSPTGTRTAQAVNEAGKVAIPIGGLTRFFIYDTSQTVADRVTLHEKLDFKTYASFIDGSDDASAQAATEVFVYEVSSQIRAIYLIIK